MGPRIDQVTTASPPAGADQVMASTEKASYGFNLEAEPEAGSNQEPLAPNPEERRLIWRQDLRIMPICAAIFFFCFIDRSNIGNAKVLNSSTHDDMQDTNAMSDKQFVICLMTYLVAYAMFEVPSNILLKKLRPSRWLAFLMFGWSVMTMTLSATHDFGSAAAVRFLLGMFEAGVLPGLVYYLTFWYRYHERSVRISMIIASATLAGTFGGAIAYGIGHMNLTGGITGWRWLFILEGIPSFLFAFFILFLLPNYPETAGGWLTEAERELAVQRLMQEGSKSHDPSMTWADAKSTLLDKRLYAHFIMYFALGIPFASLSLFSPTIVMGLGFHDLTAQLMTVPPCAVAFVCQIVVAMSADRFNARGYHVAGATFVGAIGFIASAALPATAYKSRYAAFFLAFSGTMSCVAPVLGWLSCNVISTASVGLAIAINVSIGGGLGQIPGVWIYKSSEKMEGYPTGHWTNASCLLLMTIMALGLRAFYGHKNRQLAAEAERQGTRARLYKL